MSNATKPDLIRPSTPVAWMAENNVASNLLMIVLIVGGLMVSARVKQEVFPEVQLDAVGISIPYPGASPAEVEQGILLAVEEAVRGVDGVKKVTSIGFEGAGSVTAELLLSADSNKLLQDIKNAVDRITSFPGEAERPVVTLVAGQNKNVSVVVFGDHDRLLLREVAEEVRDEMIQDPEITLVEIAGIPPMEIAVEIPMTLLREHNLTLNQVSAIIRNSALELPAGSVKTMGGDILLRTQERRDYAEDYSDIPIVSRSSGGILRLGDIAQLTDGFEEIDDEAFFNGVSAVRLDVFRVGSQTPISVSEAVYQYVEAWNLHLPDSIQLAVWDDGAVFYRGRMELLLRNAFLGLMLVLLLLGLFLDPRLAFWVTVGIPVSILGAFLLIPLFGASINMISLFAFIVTIGIIVDDAIMMGESVYHERQRGLSWARAGAQGARLMTMPIHFAVLTNVVAFLPLFFVPGSSGRLFMQIPAIVVPVLLISLIESLFVLPSHLAHGNKDNWLLRVVGVPQKMFGRLLEQFVEHRFCPFLDMSLRHRYLTLSIAVSLVVLCVATVAGGYIKFNFLPRIDSDVVTVQAALPYGSPMEHSREVQALLVESARNALDEHGGEHIAKGIYTQIGSPLSRGGPPTAGVGGGGSHQVAVQITLVASDQRDVSGVDFGRTWRRHTGEIAGVGTLAFSASIGHGGGSAVEIQLSHADHQLLESAAVDLAHSLGTYAGITDLDDGVPIGKPQMSLGLKPEARSLGLTAFDLASQVRASFYGAEALRQQRGRNEVKVMVRLPGKERKRLYTLEDLMLRTAEGVEIPLVQAADWVSGNSYTELHRADGRRIISVRADVDQAVANSNEILADVGSKVLPSLMQKYPGLSFSSEGEQRSQRETLRALIVGFSLAMFAIYAMLALPFRSYTQPVIVMISIPFGVVGAIIGHLLLGYGLSIISMFGIIALSGVVVNDALVLIVQANRNTQGGMVPIVAIRNAAVRRFRPIVLTSLTTFFGLAPMIFETSMQARFVIPMAISLGFGVLFGTLVILFLVPSVYLALEDLRGWGKAGCG